MIPMGGNPPSASVHGLPRQEYWNGLPFPMPGVLPDPGIEPTYHFMSPALAGGFFTTSTTWEAPDKVYGGTKEYSFNRFSINSVYFNI